MIEELRIQNLAVIEDTTLTFPTSYTALVGETGAGKSLVVDSLSLLTGERSDFSLVRDKTKKAVISALFSLSDSFLNDHPELKEYVGDDHTLLLKRSLLPDKSTRCSLNDEPLTLAKFRSVTSHLISIHSQGAKSELLDPTKQIIYLDRYGGEKLQKAKEQYQKAYSLYLAAQKEKEERIATNKELDRDYLEFQIKEIEKAHLQENEIEDLNKEYESLRSYERIKEKFSAFYEETEAGSPTLSDRLGNAISALSPFRDTELSEKAEALRESCEDTLASLDDFTDAFKNLNGDPKRIDEINERLFELKGLQRKYGKSTAEILAHLKDYKDKLSRLDSFEEEIKELDEKIEKAKEDASVKAETLSKLRKEAGAKMSAAIGGELSSLGLRKNGFRVEVADAELSSEGKDRVRFSVSLNAGLGEEELAKAASGGEASRLMLALKIVLNALDPYDLLVFDEIDTGVSGKTAALVAKKIRSLASSSQILVISHIPQVVASAESAIRIEKKTENGMTSTKAKLLDQDGFVNALAGMLSGEKVNAAALDAAKALIAEVHSEK